MKSRMGKRALLAIAAMAFQPAACSDPTTSIAPPEDLSQIVSQEGTEFTIKISTQIGSDNITAVDVTPEALAEVVNINGHETKIRCSKAGSGKVIIKWNNRTPNADPNGQMVRETSSFNLTCSHAQGAGG